ncbi:MAG: leucine-rich repeat protein [Oscillospiraceae bacterium]|nr:leucine-rich repeat protein [Oscillospiraceae bacterium]
MRLYRFCRPQRQQSIECIGEWTFSDCPQLTSVTVPKSVKQIEASAFFRQRQCDDPRLCGLLCRDLCEGE